MGSEIYWLASLWDPIVSWTQYYIFIEISSGIIAPTLGSRPCLTGSRGVGSPITNCPLERLGILRYVAICYFVPGDSDETDFILLTGVRNPESGFCQTNPASKIQRLKQPHVMRREAHIINNCILAGVQVLPTCQASQTVGMVRSVAVVFPCEPSNSDYALITRCHYTTWTRSPRIPLGSPSLPHYYQTSESSPQTQRHQ